MDTAGCRPARLDSVAVLANVFDTPLVTNDQSIDLVDTARVKAAGTRLDGRPIMAAAFKSGSRNVAVYTAKKPGEAGKVTWVNCDPLN